MVVKKKAAKKKSTKKASAKKRSAGGPQVLEPFAGFPKETLKFIGGLQRNNSKVWFEKHRDEYEQYYLDPALRFVNELGPKLAVISKDIVADARINGSVKRINRDVRFSKDKTPYKDHLDIALSEPKGDVALWLRIEPKDVHLGVGLYKFDKTKLTHYRDAVDSKDGDKLAKLLASLRRAGFSIGGETYKKVPSGYDPDHRHADLLKHSALYAMWSGKAPAELHSRKFMTFSMSKWKKVAGIYEWLRDL